MRDFSDDEAATSGAEDGAMATACARMEVGSFLGLRQIQILLLSIGRARCTNAVFLSLHRLADAWAFSCNLVVAGFVSAGKDGDEGE